MTVSLMGSALLSKCVQDVLTGAGQSRQQQLAALDTLPAKFHTQLAGMLDFPWTMMSGPDAL